MHTRKNISQKPHVVNNPLFTYVDCANYPPPLTLFYTYSQIKAFPVWKKALFVCPQYPHGNVKMLTTTWNVLSHGVTNLSIPSISFSHGVANLFMPSNIISHGVKDIPTASNVVSHGVKNLPTSSIPFSQYIDQP